MHAIALECGTKPYVHNILVVHTCTCTYACIVCKECKLYKEGWISIVFFTSTQRVCYGGRYDNEIFKIGLESCIYASSTEDSPHSKRATEA